MAAIDLSAQPPAVSEPAPSTVHAMPPPDPTLAWRAAFSADGASLRYAARAGHDLVLYDQRGAGGSADNEPQGWERRAADLWAVADAAGVERAVLYGVFDAGHTIAHAAALQPGRVLGLIFNRVPLAFAGAPGDSGTVPLAELERWFPHDPAAPLGDPLALMAALGINEADATALIDAWRPTVTPEALAAQETLLRAADLRPLLPALRAPALFVAPKRRPALQRW